MSNGANDSTYLIWVEEMIKWLNTEKIAEHRVNIMSVSTPSFSQNLFLFYHESDPISSEDNNYLMVIS